MNPIYRGQYPPKNTDVLWIKDNQIYIYQNGGWASVSGSIIKDAEDHLSETSENLIQNKAVYNQYMDEDDITEVIYPIIYPVLKKQPFTVEALEAGDFGIKMYDGYENDFPNLEYRKNEGEWQTVTRDQNSNITQITNLAVGDTLQLRGDNSSHFLSDDYGSPMGVFYTDIKFNVSGNIMSLLYADTFESATEMPNYCFSFLFLDSEARQGLKVISANMLILPSFTSDGCYSRMFRECTLFEKAPKLPAAVMSNSCYRDMFRNTAIRKAPDLPATTLNDYCYQCMFSGTQISELPNIPAETLVNNCFVDMFAECKNITEIPEGYLRWETLADSCYKGMFSGTSISELPYISADVLTQRCFDSMFSNCINITEIPDTYLRWETLSAGCYQDMFSGTSISRLPYIAADILVMRCFYGMFKDCKNITAIPENYLRWTTLTERCYTEMFSGCNIVSAPKLLATTLGDGCYANMFAGCTLLKEAPKLPATVLVENCYRAMFEGCTSLTSSPILPATTLLSGCYQRMFRNCSKLKKITCYAETGFSEDYCLDDWTNGVASEGTFIKKEDTEWTIGDNGIPSGWTTQNV